MPIMPNIKWEIYARSSRISYIDQCILQDFTDLKKSDHENAFIKMIKTSYK